MLLTISIILYTLLNLISSNRLKLPALYICEIIGEGAEDESTVEVMRKLDDRVVGVSLSPEVLDIINNHLHTAAIKTIDVTRNITNNVILLLSRCATTLTCLKFHDVTIKQDKRINCEEYASHLKPKGVPATSIFSVPIFNSNIHPKGGRQSVLLLSCRCETPFKEGLYCKEVGGSMDRTLAGDKERVRAGL